MTARVESAPKWHREPVTVDFGSDGWLRIDDGEWTSGRQARTAKEGVTTVAFGKTKADRTPQVREVRIDLTPPVIVLDTKPAMEQQGGVYFATPQTDFMLAARDKLSGVKTIEVSVDGRPYVPYDKPLRLAKGRHELRCRATDAAGNRTETITGQGLSGGSTDVLSVNIR